MGVLTVTFVQRGMRSPTLVYRINKQIACNHPLSTHVYYIPSTPCPPSLQFYYYEHQEHTYSFLWGCLERQRDKKNRLEKC